ncbi:hypothetical protein RCCS2_13734 [Roseobacter sp. CCS2]|nr:hypothetical protein RCCS2_13734 [Roseobacter sp. CCS2]
MAAVVYVAIVGLGAVLSLGAFAENADIATALLRLLPVQLVGAFFCYFAVTRYFGWVGAGFGRIRWVGLLWFLPACTVLVFMFLDISQAATPALWRGFGALGIAMLVIVTFCIAFGEEVIFRGILLRGAMSRLAVPVAMLLSAISFGALHAINALLGQEAGDTSLQVIFAVFVGVFLAPLALRVGNLWPLIIWHWLWNIAVILGQVVGVLHPYVLIGIAIQAVISVWLWVQFLRASRLR